MGEESRLRSGKGTIFLYFCNVFDQGFVFMSIQHNSNASNEFFIGHVYPFYCSDQKTVQAVFCGTKVFVKL